MLVSATLLTVAALVPAWRAALGTLFQRYEPNDGKLYAQAPHSQLPGAFVVLAVTGSGCASHAQTAYDKMHTRLSAA
ncbi:MAG: hypothetical protein ACR2G6_03500 [Gemmatimonadaceae bacterium]